MVSAFNLHNTMKTRFSVISVALAGQKRTIQIGQSRHTAGYNSGTPVKVIPGSSQPPELVGQPYLKTTFRNGVFRRTLYTPSTLGVIVGAQWLDRAQGITPSGEVGPFAIRTI